jgi:hypothetical protein
MITASSSDEAHRVQVLTSILDHVARGQTIRLPEWDRSVPVASTDYALLNVGLEPNQFGGFCGEMRYQFEGEDDLLHLMICRRDGEAMDVRSAQETASWLLRGVPTGLYWVKHASRSSHFYVGHDILPGSLQV